MRILIWNCEQSVRKKFDAILRLSPDIAIICNSEFPDRLYPKQNGKKLSGVLWTGSERNAGLGVYAFGAWRLDYHPSYNRSVKSILPLECTNSEATVFLVALQGISPKKRQYGQALFCYHEIKGYIDLIGHRSAILAGDFGAAAAALPGQESFDEGFLSLEQDLARRDLRSCYHSFTREKPGREKRATHFDNQNLEKGAHSTYCFASTDLLLGLSDVQTGDPESWLDYSNHMPLVIDLA